jgi:hypothetical protein
MQLSYSHAAVKHTLIAMASMHEALRSTNWYMNANDNDHGRSLRLFSWQQYNQAIQLILRGTSTDRMPIEVLILLCLLFNQYHNFQCDYSAAYMHIKSGLQLIADFQRSPSSGKPKVGPTMTESEMIRDHVAPMLLRMDVQAAFLMHSEAHSPPYDKLTQTAPPVLPQDFNSFSLARRTFDHAASYMFHVLGKRIEDCDEAGKVKAKDTFEQWWSKFSALAARTPVRLGTDEDRAIRLLRIYYNFARVVLDTHHDGNEMGFDNQTSRFEVMVQQARDLVYFNPTSHEHMTQPFSFDISLASPLNFIAARCREPELRRQAIAMLKASKKSSWNSEHCAVTAQFLLEHEEGGLPTVKTCSNIPSKKRVRRITTEICFEESAIRVTYVKYALTYYPCHLPETDQAIN